jgi:hypothetical protein
MTASSAKGHPTGFEAMRTDVKAQADPRPYEGLLQPFTILTLVLVVLTPVALGVVVDVKLGPWAITGLRGCSSHREEDTDALLSRK